MASVCPYITHIRPPRSLISSCKPMIDSGARRPPACVRVRIVSGIALRSKPVRSRMAYEYGTPANDVACQRVASSQNSGRMIECGVRITLAPEARWLLSTDRP